MIKRPRITIARLMLGLAALVGVVLALPTLINGIPTRRIVEELRAPVAVVGWTTAGLRLADGRVVLPAGLLALPATSEALAEATGRGVEVAPDGRVVGLVRVHRTCGNDPVRERIVRVDLARFLEFLGEGTTVGPPDPEPAKLRAELGRVDHFSPNGWRVGDYQLFRPWERLAAEARQLPAASRSVMPGAGP